MRENRKFEEYVTAYNELHYLTPKVIREGRSPSATMCAGKLAFFNKHITLGKEVLAWCMPAESGDLNRQNFHALPIEDLDAIHSIYLLNEYLATDENHPDYEIRKAAIATVLQGLVTLRPHRILCAEGEVASDTTLDALETREFFVGQPSITIGEISYLGTFQLPNRVFLAVGTNASTYVNGITENYVGPVYIEGLVNTAGHDELCKGKPVSLLSEHTKQRLAQRYENRDDMSKLDQLILEMLNSQP